MAKETTNQQYPTFEHKNPYFRLSVSMGAMQFLGGKYTPKNENEYKILLEYMDNQPDDVRISE